MVPCCTATTMSLGHTVQHNTCRQQGWTKKKSDTIIPSWMSSSGKQIVSPERVSELLQRAENTLSYFLLLLWYFKLWNLIEKPADGHLNAPLFSPQFPSLIFSCPPPTLPLLFLFLGKPETVAVLAAPSLQVPSVQNSTDPWCILAAIQMCSSVNTCC